MCGEFSFRSNVSVYWLMPSTISSDLDVGCESIKSVDVAVVRPPYGASEFKFEVSVFNSNVYR